MEEKARVLFVSQEIMPYLPETEISRISRMLPQGILERGKEVRTFMPRYGNVNERRNQLHEVIRLSGMNLIIDDTDHPLIIKVASIQSARMQIYFIDNEDFFKRKSALYTPTGAEHPDNDERAMFFARGVLETTRKLGWAPHIIHVHGWFSSYVPLYVRLWMNHDPYFEKSKIVLSIYDESFKTKWEDNLNKKIYADGIDEEGLAKVHVTDYMSMMKMAIDFSDGVICGSQKVNEELVEYAKSLGKPVLPYHPEDTYMDAFNEFYDSLLQ
ncbi:MAG: glycogen synthase [Bacteroidales bacterium]|jgi:starch synthase|nr:glycogen synthase [Bacteroidales bacterium]